MYQPSLVPAVSRIVAPTTRRYCGRQKYPTTASGFSLLVGAWHFAWLVLALLWPSPATAEPPSTDTQSLSQELERLVLPLLDRYCLDCHDRETSEGEIDLEQFIDLDDVRRELGAWQSLLAQLQIGDMPPATSDQPSVTERETLIRWTKQFLRTEALANAGDPGPVVLRRLSNAEYAYSLRDLTSVESLDPTHEFPVDGAAGEGFTNAGDALVMSPTLLTKYIDAAKDVAEHAVLLPGGITFSDATTQRDRTEEKLAAIRNFYSQFAESGGATSLSLQGVKIASDDAGVIPLEKYLVVTLEEREAISSGVATLDEVANRHGLNAKYLRSLWESLTDTASSLPLDLIRRQWRAATPVDAAELAETTRRWQRAVWTFTTVGHIGKRDGPQAWQIPVSPLASVSELQVKLPDNDQDDLISLYLVTSDAGDGNSDDVVVWREPRIVFANRPPIRLLDVQPVTQRARAMMQSELNRVGEYLLVVEEAHASKTAVERLAAERHLNPTLAANWASLTGLSHSTAPTAKGHYTNRLSDVGGHASVHGWGFEQTPSLLVNHSDEALTITTLTVPGHSVVVHPSPQDEAIVYWRSPIDSEVRVEGLVADADAQCGNGVAWRVELINNAGTVGVAAGTIDNGSRQTVTVSKPLKVTTGDLISLVVNARDRQHACDTTHIALRITEAGNQARTWDLAEDIVSRVQESNPLADRYGNADTWHFCATRESAVAKDAIPPGSALANWRDAAQSNDNNVDIRKLALGVQGVMIAADMQSLSAEDKSLREELLDWHGPLEWLSLASNEIGTRPNGDIEATAPSTLEFRLPVELAAGADFVTTGTLHPVKGKQGSVQMQALLSKPSGEVGLEIGGWKKQGDRKLWTDADTAIESDLPILINESGDAKRRIEKGIDAFRQVFPAALCYTKIVPVDEVVTLTLYYREDAQLRRLMLNDQQAQTLDELWDGLRFVSHEPLQLVDAFEQLWQFATQDADPSAFEPLRQPIIERAESFRKILAAAEPRHVEAVLDFAERAWRRPLTSAECDNLQALYQQLRDQELQHDEAVRTLLARVLIAPAFLYKLEESSAGTKPSSVSDLELATRLSYFLWSSTPDSELMSLAQSGKLSDPLVLIGQTRRMLRDAKMRRFAIHFGCQWLGVRDFDTHDEKSERHFPEFAGLRSAMYEEPIRFLTNLVHHDSSVLSILNADHTFVDPALAEFYRFPKPASQDWVRVDGVHRFGRGGVLSMAATLARQSGASRTSPILRGNWVYETLLGQHLPRPPKDIPQLPDTVPEGLTERQLIEQHSSAPACAKCHVKIDPFGFALEGFDAIGRARSAVDTRTRLPNGKRIEGLEGLRGYLLEDRRDDFLRQFCRKLLGYGLGRAVQLSDDPLIDTMLQELATNEFRVGVAIEQVVLSPQFRMIRGQAREAEQ